MGREGDWAKIPDIVPELGLPGNAGDAVRSMYLRRLSRAAKADLQRRSLAAAERGNTAEVEQCLGALFPRVKTSVIKAFAADSERNLKPEVFVFLAAEQREAMAVQKSKTRSQKYACTGIIW